jgi:hypothetical protein
MMTAATMAQMPSALMVRPKRLISSLSGITRLYGNGQFLTECAALENMMWGLAIVCQKQAPRRNSPRVFEDDVWSDNQRAEKICNKYLFEPDHQLHINRAGDGVECTGELGVVVVTMAIAKARKPAGQ